MRQRTSPDGPGAVLWPDAFHPDAGPEDVIQNSVGKAAPAHPNRLHGRPGPDHPG